MATYKTSRRVLAWFGGAIAGALLLWAGTPVLLGQGAHAAGAQRNVYAVLTGTWLGPGIGDAGNCGTEYGQFTFFRNAEYDYTSNSELCGGFTNAGYYRVQNGVITLHWVECNYPCAAGTVSARFTFVGLNAFEISDPGRTYEYYRQ